MHSTTRRLAARIHALRMPAARRWARADLLTVAAWLARRVGVEAARSVRSWFGRHLKALFREVFGTAPMERVEDIDTRRGRREITVAGYPPNALPLFETVAARMGI